MAVKALPDRERRHLLQFYILPRIPYGIRLAAAVGLIVCGLGLQFLSPSGAIVPYVGVGLLLAGNLLLLVRGYDLTPKGLRKTRWEKTTHDRFAEVRRLEGQVRWWDETFADITCVLGVFCLVVIAAGVLAVAYVLAERFGQEQWATLFVADAVALVVPHWLTGTRKGWRPTALRQQIGALETAIATIDQYKEPPCQVQPMFEVAGGETTCAPVGARIFIRFPDGPEDFLGLQFQVALNDVQGTKYPYLYAVLVAKELFGLRERCHARIKASAGKGIKIEVKREDDVDVIVIRQQTRGRNKGYHTKDKDIRRIAQVAWEGATLAVSS